jgi:PTH1 family peptidyl-tRNA hydrolase
MNMSGEAAQRLLHYFHLPLQKTLVVFDDLDLPTAALRMRPLGGSAGHKGMQSVIDRLGSRAIPRLRVGIDRPPGKMDPAAYVLQPFSDEQQELIDAALPRAAEAIETFVSTDIDSAMSALNSAASGE